MPANSLLLAMMLLMLATPRFGLAGVRQPGGGNSQSTLSGSVKAMGAPNWKAAARLHRGISKTSGTLIVDNQGINFQPDKGNSVRWSFEEIESLQLGARLLIVKTYESRGWHRPGTRQLHFTLQSNIPPALAAVLVERVQKPSRNGDPVEKRAGFASLPAHHRSAWGGGSNGVLRFHDGGIDYVSQTGKDGRSWRWADIQTLTSPDPFHLTVFGYIETYSFDLKQPLQQKIYDRLTDEVYLHHEELRKTSDTGDRRTTD